MLNKLVFYTKMGYKLLKREVVNKKDYVKEYNKVAETYKYWLREMGKYTDRIINSKHILEIKESKILDFACGTGYITRSLLEKDFKGEITAVDFSENMLKEWRETLEQGVNLGHRVNVVHADGIEFLKNTEQRFDIIFFGWALSYFNYKELFSLFNKVLNKGGVVAIITNTQGTLYRMEQIFLKVMKENSEEIIKPMDIRFNLPKGSLGLIRWFKQYGFEALETEENEVEFLFNKPEELLEWLNKTGALAGTAQIFRNYDMVKDKIVEEIKGEKCKEGRYSINHKFAYGIFRKV
ncbi:class I SAM-dependent methyltransferase [Desnuesiella massiliensis]|uniref:class I SAM-dependent methyltransferase n=1 Tax=Desnuesiella massiliensis TaxID=1650662 RepID=UPI0006E3A818|nr:class I SAM-dependent methyltransferase [Desnuesiella massiliensis]